MEDKKIEERESKKFYKLPHDENEKRLEVLKENPWRYIYHTKGRRQKIKNKKYDVYVKYNIYILRKEEDKKSLEELLKDLHSKKKRV